MMTSVTFSIITKIGFIIRKHISFLFALAILLIANKLAAQTPTLFQSDEILDITLKCDMKALMKDRGDDPQYHESTITIKHGTTEETLPVRIKARGNFRKMSSNCKYPPIFLNFKKDKVPKESVFYGQDKSKLVIPCRGDNYIVNEYLVYKLYNLFTPKSFNARLVRLTFYDEVKDKTSDPYFSFVIEEEEQMATRNRSISVERNGVKPKFTSREDFLTMAVFQFLIGNTDWSIQYQQNIKFLSDTLYPAIVTVPYDFDHAGIVRAPYARPAPELKLPTTQHRRYRGYCIENMEEYAPVFAKFNAFKEDIYAIYEKNPFINDNYRKQTIKFLDDFYEIINDPKKAEREFTYPCNPSGTGNVIIKGLNTN